MLLVIKKFYGFHMAAVVGYIRGVALESKLIIEINLIAKTMLMSYKPLLSL